MAKIQGPFSFTNITDMPTLVQYLTNFATNTSNTVNGMLNFTDNFVANVVSVSFPSGSLVIQVPHNLGITPTGYIVVKLNQPAIVYSGNPLGAGATFINLACNTSGTNASILFF